MFLCFVPLLIECKNNHFNKNIYVFKSFHYNELDLILKIKHLFLIVIKKN